VYAQMLAISPQHLIGRANNEPPQSMISSARCMTASGIVRPCAFAVYVQFHCRSVDLGVNKGQ
jgi:hypothetical protein